MDSAPSSDWLTTITRSFDENPELQLAARQQLAEQAINADPAQLESLAARFASIDGIPPRQRRLHKRLPVVLAVIGTLLAALLSALPYLKVRKLSEPVVSGFGWSPPQPHAQAKAMRSLLSPEDHFAIFGDTTQPTAELAVRALWQSDPDNPVLFNDYLNHCSSYPDDLLETAARIDPDNGWFLLISAGELGSESMTKKRRPWSGPFDERPIVADWEIKEPSEFHESLALIKKAAAMPRIEGYDAQSLRRRLTLVPPERDVPSRIVRLIHGASVPSDGLFKILSCGKILSTHIYQSGQAGDTEALRAIIPTVETLGRELNQTEGLVITPLIVLYFCQSTYEHLLEACEQNNMTAEAARLRPVVMALRTERRAQREREFDNPDLMHKRAGTITAMAGGLLARFGIPAPADEDLKPGRLADYALADRVSLLAAALLLLLATLGAFLIPRFHGTLPAMLGKRFAQLPDQRDWLWILGLGTILPLAWLLAITRLTPLGGRDWGITFFLFQPIGSQYAFAFLLLVAGTLWTVRWRLAKHAGTLGFGTLPGKRSLLPALLLALSIPIAGLVPVTMSMVPLAIAIALATLATLWLLILLGRTVLSRPQHAPRRAAVARILPRAFAHAVLLLLALVPLTFVAERHWIARDALGRTSPERLGMGRLEIEATRTLQATIREALDASSTP